MKKIMFYLTIFTLSLPAFGQDKLNIVVDPGVELLSVVLSVSDYDSIMMSRGSFPLITRFDFEYKEDMLSSFQQHKDDKIFSTFADMFNNYGFFFSFPIQACLVTSGLPDMRIDKIVNEMLLTRSGGLENLKRFLDQMSGFYQRAEFSSFLDKHNDYYQAITAKVKSMPANEMVLQMEDYYGEQQASYNIVLASMLHPGGYGPHLYDSLGNKHIYSIIGPKSINDGLPQFGTLEEFRYLIWHEFSHSFVNPVVDEFYADIDQYKSLFNPLAEKLKNQRIADWRDCVTEHVVRAVTVRLSYLYLGEMEGEKAMERETGMGFAYVPELCRELEKYESQREQYPTLSDYYPRIIELFGEMTGGSQ